MKLAIVADKNIRRSQRFCNSCEGAAAIFQRSADRSMSAEHAALMTLLTADDYEVVSALAECCDVSEVEALSKALLNLLSARQATEVAARLLTDEVKRHAAHPHQILRSQSLASRVLAVHSRAVGGDFLRATLGAHVRGRCRRQLCCETVG